jgi:hypothetical protein
MPALSSRRRCHSEPERKPSRTLPETTWEPSVHCTSSCISSPPCGPRECCSILNQPNKSAIRVYEGSHSTAPGFELGRVKSRLPFALFGYTGLFADRVKSIQVIQPKATAKPTGRRVEFGMWKELQRQIATIQRTCEKFWCRMFRRPNV